MMNNSSCSYSSLLRPVKKDELELVLAWRNHPDIRRFMYTSHQIELSEHLAWFEHASKDPNRHLLIFEQNGIATGFVNICAQGDRIADWGFYLAPNTPKGSGINLGRSALQYCFTSLKLHKLCGEALGFNEKSIRFHLKLGFTQEGILREQHFDGQKYQDIVQFGLLAGEWKSFL